MELSKGTQKMLEGLGHGDVTVTNLAEYIAQAGVFVKIHVKRCRGSIALPPRAVGVRVDRMSDEAKVAYDNIVRLGNLNFVPREDENQLLSIEASLRRRLYESTTADGFMPAELFDAFKEDFAKYKADYLKQRDAIQDKWDSLVEEFSTSVRNMLAGIRMLQRDRKRLHEKIMKSLPSKEHYMDSFEMSMSVTAYPAVSACSETLPEGVQDAIKDSWAEMTVALAEQSIMSLLVSVFDSVNDAVRGFMKTGTIHGKRINALVRQGARLKKMNLFANPAVDETAEILANLAKQDLTEAEAQLEECIISIYRYADSVGFELGLENCVFPKEVLMPAAA